MVVGSPGPVGAPSGPAGAATTSPTARVLTSAHTPPRSGTIAPSTLTSWTGGPGDAAGRRRTGPSSRAAASASRASWAAPAAPVRRRSVSAPTRTPVKCASSAVAWA